MQLVLNLKNLILANLILKNEFQKTRIQKQEYKSKNTRYIRFRVFFIMIKKMFWKFWKTKQDWQVLKMFYIKTKLQNH